MQYYMLYQLTWDAHQRKGLKLFGWSDAPLLWIGLTCASFHALGSFELDKEALNIRVRVASGSVLVIRSPLYFHYSALLQSLNRAAVHTTPANYRPVSLTSICCKMLEHIVFHSIQRCLNELSVYQHGFRKHIFWTTQLACVTHDLMNNFDKGIPAYAAVLDFSKALDIVPHNKLIQKLVACNVNAVLIRWFL